MIQKFCYITVFLFLSVIKLNAQVKSNAIISTKELELIKSEIQQANGNKLDAKTLDEMVRLQVQQEQLVKEMGLSKYLETYRFGDLNKSAMATQNLDPVASCDDYNFDVQPQFKNWTLLHNIAPFQYNDAFNEKVINNSTINDRYLDAEKQERFAITNDNYFDTYMNQKIPSGVIKIGNNLPNAGKESITKTFKLNGKDDFIIYDFAIVLHDTGHEERPFYKINIRDSKGNLKPCSEILYVATSNNLGFIQSKGQSDVWYRPWSTNIIKPFDFGINIGETYSLEISVSDCKYNPGHFGYGYFDIRCMEEDKLIEIIGSNCVGRAVTVSSAFKSIIDNFSWTIYNHDGTSTSYTGQSDTIKHVFPQEGVYTIELSVPYFTTTAGCNVVSKFKKNVTIGYCPPPNEDCIDCSSFDLIRNKTYLVSGWVKEDRVIKDQADTYDKIAISVAQYDYNGNVIENQTFKPEGHVIEGWQQVLGTFTVHPAIDDLVIKLENLNEEGKNVYFDDIRVIPSDASMKSYVYDQKTQKLMAELDDNNYATFYEYDLEGGLVRIKKETEKGVYTIQETRSSQVKQN